MPETSIRLPYPRGFMRLIMRLPILLYRLRLGWLLGKRFLLLEHRGRKSGILRRVVVEVVDRNPERNSFIVAAAWGTKSDWYRNILAEPKVTIRAGFQKIPATARTLPAEEAARHLSVYARQHPVAFRYLGSLLIGSTTRAADEIMKAFAASIPLVEFRPR